MQEKFEKSILEKVFELLSDAGLEKTNIHDMDMSDIEYEAAILASRMNGAVIYHRWRIKEKEAKM